MSKQIEDIFKNSLEHYEESYDPSAWDALQARLDSKSEPNQKTKKTNWKTFSIVAVGLTIGGYYFFKSSEEKPVQKVEEKETLKTAQETKSENKEIKITTPTKNNPTRKFKSTEVVNLNPQKTIEKTIEITPTTEDKHDTQVSNKSFEMSSREVYCQGEKATFKNENDFTVYLIHQSGKYHTIKKNDKLTLELIDSGDYYWSFENNLNTVNKMHAFEVIVSPNLNFTLPNDFDFSDGLPKIQLASNSKGNNKWYLNGKPIAQGKEVDINIFSKGSYEIKLINEFNGCQSELSKNFNSSENYNLLSVTGIDPNHSDPKRNSFIPYALTIRKVNFRMFIISQSTGEIIFETNDVDRPWKGQNQKTNELVPENSEYIWKVIINDPEKGEKSEYKGRVTRI
jgi:hypothetical protein